MRRIQSQQERYIIQEFRSMNEIGQAMLIVQLNHLVNYDPYKINGKSTSKNKLAEHQFQENVRKRSKEIINSKIGGC